VHASGYGSTAASAHPELLDFLDAEPNLEYVVAMAKNAVLKRKAKPAMRQARRLSRQSGKTGHVYGEARYAARSWPQQRRIIIKAEVVRAEGKKPKDNPRFVITNMKQNPQWLYEEVYCQRGESRESDQRTARPPDRPHQLQRLLGQPARVLLTAAAYVLMQELRLHAAHTSCARAQVWTLRERLLNWGPGCWFRFAAWSCACPRRSRSCPPSGKWHWHSEPRRDSAASPPETYFSNLAQTADKEKHCSK